MSRGRAFGTATFRRRIHSKPYEMQRRRCTAQARGRTANSGRARKSCSPWSKAAEPPSGRVGEHCFDDEGSNKRCLTIFSTRRTARRIPSYQITILLPQHSHRAEQHVSKQLLIGRPRRPSLAARRAALALAVPRESRASARPSAPATRTSVPSITRVGLKIVARLRLQAPAVLGGLRAVWRVRGPPRRGVMIRRPRPCRCFGGPKSTAVSSMTSVGLSKMPPRAAKLPSFISFAPASV